ncbi:transcriptional regulator [Streptomyces sp. RY43-2]|uniref:Transcriptional regulator n=1 Tax=Streptomyces macrolidinus TaxID=2952607 RepID=A0ABT0ZMY2_9ACTN|nr:transcriptional regulator [Streptomyces macrolidinus]MCN9244953.1 transcriptional regulator [Streptomyces macrolidinus]
MADSARQILAEMRSELAPVAGENTFVELVAAGGASQETLHRYANEEHLIFTSDWGSYLSLAGRSTAPDTRQFFMGLALGEAMGLPGLAVLSAALGVDEDARRTYEPMPLCQAYPAYTAWLSLNADPADVVAALLANFPGWCGYFATLAGALRKHHGLDDQACAFLDGLSTPNPQLEAQGIAILDQRLSEGWTPGTARRYARYMRTYDLLFWNSLVETTA